MTPETVLTIGRSALEATVLLATPLLAVALVVGVVIGLLQAATQINEMTLSFVPKLVVMVIALVIGGPWMLETLMDFTVRLIRSIPQVIG